jgi:hypothetical protein
MTTQDQDLLIRIKAVGDKWFVEAIEKHGFKVMWQIEIRASDEYRFQPSYVAKVCFREGKLCFDTVERNTDSYTQFIKDALIKQFGDLANVQTLEEVFDFLKQIVPCSIEEFSYRPKMIDTWLRDGFVKCKK